MCIIRFPVEESEMSPIQLENFIVMKKLLGNSVRKSLSIIFFKLKQFIIRTTNYSYIDTNQIVT